jgi:hypothetical protein
MTDFDLTLTRPLLFLPGLGAAAAVLAAAVLVVMPAPEAAVAIAAPAGPLPASQAVIASDRTCATCGFMKTIRRTDPVTGVPAYQFSVRMRDGSTRDSTETTRGRWIEGDRVILIGGAAARALEVEKNAAL